MFGRKRNTLEDAALSLARRANERLAALGDVDAKLRGIEAQASARFGEIAKAVDSTARAAEAHNEALEALHRTLKHSLAEAEEKVTALAAQHAQHVESVQQQADALKALYDDVLAKADAATDRVAELERDVAAKLAAYDRALGVRWYAMDQRLSRLEPRASFPERTIADEFARYAQQSEAMVRGPSAADLADKSLATQARLGPHPDARAGWPQDRAERERYHQGDAAPRDTSPLTPYGLLGAQAALQAQGPSNDAFGPETGEIGGPVPATISADVVVSLRPLEPAPDLPADAPEPKTNPIG